MSSRSSKLKESLVWFALLLPLLAYGHRALQRPSRTPITNQPLFNGITYSRWQQNTPRPQLLHLLDIDLTAPGLSAFSNPPLTGTPNLTSDQEIGETRALRTSHFLQRYGLQLAVNANFFYPFAEKSAWQYEPTEGEPVNLIGVGMSDGTVVSGIHPRYYALCFLPQRVTVAWESLCPEGTQQAVAGQALWLTEEPLPEGMEFLAKEEGLDKNYPINIAAINADGTRLWLLITDGKQPLYSEGTTLREATEILKEVGAVRAVQLDGGGSTTIAIEENGKPKILNAVIHAKIPGLERPVANSLGFFADPIENP